MTRKEIFDLVNTVCPAHWVGQHQGECKKPYAVIKYKNQSTSLNSAVAGWQYIDIMVYVPCTSTATIDSKMDEVRSALVGAGVEPTGNRTPDYIDQEKKALMRSEEYRMPKVII